MTNVPVQLDERGRFPDDDDVYKYVVLGKTNCEWCDKTIQLFEDKDIPFLYLNIDEQMDLYGKAFHNMLRSMDLTTVPQVFKLIGGFSDISQEFSNVPDVPYE